MKLGYEERTLLHIILCHAVDMFLIVKIDVSVTQAFVVMTSRLSDIRCSIREEIGERAATSC
jgi:hypothetical protein